MYAKVSGKTLRKILIQKIPGIIGVKYRISLSTRECQYGLIFACPLILDFWERFSYNLEWFGKGLLPCLNSEELGNFTIYILNI